MRDDATLTAALERRLATTFGCAVAVDNVSPVSMGASKAIWRFTATPTDGAAVELVVRADPVENPRPEAMALEAAVLRAAYDAGVPVPRVIDSGDGGDGIGSPFVIMSAVAGETLPQRNLRHPAVADNRAALTKALGRSIAAIHRLPRDLPGLRETNDVVEYDALYREGALSPAFELALRWLAEHPQPTRESVVVHGDFRHGNLIIDDGQLAAVLDWELVHIGDPLEDLGWLCTKAWRFGGAHPVGGFGEVDDLLDGYAEVAGWRPDRHDVVWWAVFGSIRWGVMCRRQASRHLSGTEQSLELALIGRRFAENEFDVLLGLGLAQSVDAPPSPEPPPPDPLFGEPTVGDLLDALITRVSESANYDDRLTRNALNVVRRELLLGRSVSAQVDGALQGAGFASEQHLAEAIRDGIKPTAAMLDAVRAGVRARLEVWNPKYLSYPPSSLVAATS